MKKLCAVVLVICIAAALFAGCAAPASTESSAPASSPAASSAAASSSAPAEATKIKIGVTSMTMKESVYKFMMDAAIAKAAELGVELQWQACENDPQVQLNQVQDYISKGVNVVVIEPARSDAAVPMVKACNDANIPVINLEALIKGIDTKMRIVADSVKVGELQAQDFVDKVWDKKPANVVLLSGTKGDEVAEDITEGNMNVLGKYPDIKVVVSQSHEAWDRTLAMNTMQDALAKYNNDIKAVFANNDTMALGAMKAAEQAGVKDKIWYYGADHDKDSVLAIQAGENLKVVDKGAIMQGENVVIAAIAVSKGETPSEAVDVNGTKVWWTPIALVSKDNLEPAKAKFPDLFK